MNKKSNQKLTKEDVGAFTAAYLRVKAYLPPSYVKFIEHAIRALRCKLPVE